MRGAETGPDIETRARRGAAPGSSIGVALALMMIGASAGAQSTGSFPPLEGSGGSPPPEQPGTGAPGAGQEAPSDRTSPEAAASPPGPSSGQGGYTPPPPPSVPLRGAGQSLGPYRRPEGAAMPGDGLGERPAPHLKAPISDYRHDGFYLRLAGGLGTATDTQSTSSPIPTDRNFRPRFAMQPYEGSASGLAPGTQVAVGFTPVRGLAVGVVADTVTILEPTADVPDPNTGNYLYRTSQFALFSLFGDFYFDPELGIHLQAGLGLATYVAGVGDPENPNGPRAQAHTAVGFGFMAGVGYEWFVGRQWSAGLLGRFLWGTTSGQDPKGVDWSHQTLSPALMVGLTYH